MITITSTTQYRGHLSDFFPIWRTQNYKFLNLLKKNVQKGSLGQGIQILTPIMKIQYGGSNMAVKFSKKRIL